MQLVFLENDDLIGWRKFRQSGPILESKGMRVIFQKKGQKRSKNVKGKIFENLGKNVQNLKIFWKTAGDSMRLETARIDPGKVCDSIFL